MQEYVKISRELILNAKRPLAVDLFTHHRLENGHDEYVLFCKAGLTHAGVERILSATVGPLYVRNDSVDQYNVYVESNLTDIVGDPKITLEEKTSAVYNCATSVVQDVFEDPRSGENMQRSRDLVNNMVRFTFNEPGAIKGLLGLGQKDYYTFTHCIHVSVFCVGLAKVFNIRKHDEIYQLGLGALMHDVGKIKIDPKILNKPGKLTSEEFEEIKKHPRYGYEMLKDSLPAASLDIVLHHHEKFNGAGYPDGLSKANISMNAKIACIADVYDALTTNRCYAKARNPFEAITTMKNEMIGQFEEEKFLAFIRMLGPGLTI